MLTSYRVGAVFTVVDEISPVLFSLSSKFGEFGKLVGGIKESLATLGSFSTAPAVESFARMNGAIEGTIAKVAELKTSLATIGSATAGANRAAFAGIALVEAAGMSA